MKIIKKFKIGSSVFFKNIENFISKDIDKLFIIDSNLPDILNMKDNNIDIFFCPNFTKEQFIENTINSDVAMRVGKFLIPEFSNYIGFTINDLHLLSDLFNKLDDKHKYEIIIKNAYLKNNSFTLTDEQLNEAYKEYKKYR